jgi:hypothetical protein
MPAFDLQGEDVSASDLAGAVRALTGDNKQLLGDLIVELKNDEKLLNGYADVQHLQLIQLQHKLLANGITDQKLYDAPLRDVVSAFKVLKDKELVSQGKPTEIHGLVGYLVELEKEEEQNEIDITPEEGAEVSNFPNDDVTSPVPMAGVETHTSEEDIPCL